MPEPEDEQSRPEDPAPAAPAHANSGSLEWTSKAEYLATRPPSEVPRATRWWGIAFAICLLVWLIDMFLLGDLTAVGGPSEDKWIPGKPIATAALLGMVVSYFGTVVCIWGVKRWKGWSRSMLIVGLVAVANPVGGIVLIWVTLCGWSGCYAP